MEAGAAGEEKTRRRYWARSFVGKWRIRRAARRRASRFVTARNDGPN
jgi:hypothetical protein